MSWFRRRDKTENSVPPEVQEYYQSERRERVGIAWMLALATLVVTVLLAFGLFYGGRWAYRALFDRPNDVAPTEPAPAGVTQPPTPVAPPTDAPAGQAPPPEAQPRPPQVGPVLPEVGSPDNL